jgi:hypothetical protein
MTKKPFSFLREIVFFQKYINKGAPDRQLHFFVVQLHFCVVQLHFCVVSKILIISYLAAPLLNFLPILLSPQPFYSNASAIVVAAAIAAVIIVITPVPADVATATAATAALILAALLLPSSSLPLLT